MATEYYQFRGTVQTDYTVAFTIDTSTAANGNWLGFTVQPRDVVMTSDELSQEFLETATGNDGSLEWQRVRATTPDVDLDAIQSAAVSVGVPARQRRPIADFQPKQTRWIASTRPAKEDARTR